ncbi:MAG TPA: hypothetical protein DCZ10_01350, partial [Pelotomaculum sp.]|nr:hypothetical protein [Pelotomaculum sp.]
MAQDNLLKIMNKTTGPFHTANPDFDILKSNLHDKELLETLNWAGLDKESTINQLKAQQRVLRIHPDVNAAQFLLDNGMDSAHKIAAMPRQQFVQLCNSGNSLNGNDDKAVEIYDEAVQVKTRVHHLLASIGNIVGSSYYRATLFNNASPELIEYYENLPGYQELFGSLDYFRCNPSYTIFSPSAYFLDLMRITDKYITCPNTAKPEGNIPQGFTLQERRPDLFEMKLDSDNTNTVISYLQLINEILERRIENEYVLNAGAARAGGASSITLAADASAQNGFYNRLSVEITGGTGIGQRRAVSSYDGAGKIAAVDSPWETQPDHTSGYRILDSAFKVLAAAGYPFNLPFNLPLRQLRLYLENLNASLSRIYLDFSAPKTAGTVQA